MGGPLRAPLWGEAEPCAGALSHVALLDCDDPELFKLGCLAAKNGVAHLELITDGGKLHAIGCVQRGNEGEPHGMGEVVDELVPGVLVAHLRASIHAPASVTIASAAEDAITNQVWPGKIK